MRVWVSIIGSALFAASLGACEQPTARSGQVVATGEVQIGGPYTLTNHHGETVTEASFLGRPQLIYFGFSYCPDVCPLALQQMGQALAEVDPDGDYFQPIFISVDPDRDTPESLREYITANGFPKGLVGLTGTPEQVDVAKAAYKVYSAKVQDPSMTGGYTVDHASLVFLMDKTGKFANVFTHNTATADMIAGLRDFKERN